MAALPTLRPNGQGTDNSTVANESVGTTNLHLSVDDDPDSHDSDTTYIRNLNYVSSCWLLLDDMPSDFYSLDTISIKIAWRGVGRDDDALGLSVQLFGSDEVTAITSELNYVHVSHSPSASYSLLSASGSSSPSLTITGATTKTALDGARLRLRWHGSASMGNDGATIRVTAVELNGTYIKTKYAFSDALFPSGVARVGPFKV